ncbi:MAG: DNA repair protein RecO, partial [Acidimicrobiia bacterium]
YGCLTHAVSMLEAADQVAQDREANPALYLMLSRALRTLADDPSPLVSAAFFWKLLSLEGFHPMLDACVRCSDDTGPFPAFDLSEGGVLCASCGRVTGRRLPAETLDLVRRVLGGDLRGALAEPPSSTTTDAERLAVATLEHHFERRLRSAALL